jgi:hypothetical protein
MADMKKKPWNIKFRQNPWWHLVLFLFLMCLAPSSVQAVEIKLENKIKAAFLINFILYIENKENNVTQNLCLFDREKFGNFIQKVLKDKKQKFSTLNLSIRYVNIGSTIEDCHVLFISSRNVPHIELTEYPEHVLTIGETSDFLASGGMINFFIEDNRIFFEINMAAINNSGITLSSQLLKLARTRGKD